METGSGLSFEFLWVVSCFKYHVWLYVIYIYIYDIHTHYDSEFFGWWFPIVHIFWLHKPTQKRGEKPGDRCAAQQRDCADRVLGGWDGMLSDLRSGRVITAVPRFAPQEMEISRKQWEVELAQGVWLCSANRGLSIRCWGIMPDFLVSLL